MTSSFELVEDPSAKISPKSYWDYDDFLYHLNNASHLQLKKPTKEDKRIAEQKRIDQILLLANKNRLEITTEFAKELVNALESKREASYLAYLQGLFDRLEGLEVGPYILVLWRGIAWNNSGAPIHGFRLETKDFLDAKAHLTECINRYLLQQ